MISRIKKMIPLKYKENFLYLLGIRNFKEYLKLYTKDKVFVFLATDYRNIGDAAITYSQVELLKQAFPSFKIIEVPLRLTLSHLLPIKLFSKKTDLITITGGGHLGDLYFGVQELKHKIIKKFPYNRILSFPQSNNFQPKSKNTLINFAIKVYESHSNLQLLIRDKISFDFIKSKMPNVEIILCPDIVLTQNFYKNPKERLGIMMMLRNDVESSLNSEDKNNIKGIISGFDVNFETTDTLHKTNMIDVEYRNDVFKNFINKIKRKSLVITDRLHGVIFCYITKTPCLAINSHNNKVKNAIESYMKCDYINIIESYDDSIFAEKVAHLINNRKNFDYKNRTEEYRNFVLKIMNKNYEN